MKNSDLLDFVNNFETTYGITEKNNKYYINNKTVQFEENECFAISYTEDVYNNTQILQKYGTSNWIKEYTLNTNKIFKEKLPNYLYEDLKLLYLEIPRKDFQWINVFINISASNWINNYKKFIAQRNNIVI